MDIDKQIQRHLKQNITMISARLKDILSFVGNLIIDYYNNFKNVNLLSSIASYVYMSLL